MLAAASDAGNQRLAQPLPEQAPIGQACQGIVKGQIPYFFFVCLRCGYISNERKNAGLAFDFRERSGQLSPENLSVLPSQAYFQIPASSILLKHFSEFEAIVFVGPHVDFQGGAPDNLVTLESHQLEKSGVCVDNRSIAHPRYQNSARTRLKGAAIAFVAGLLDLDGEDPLSLD